MLYVFKLTWKYGKKDTAILMGVYRRRSSKVSKEIVCDKMAIMLAEKAVNRSMLKTKPVRKRTLCDPLRGSRSYPCWATNAATWDKVNFRK